MAETLTPGDYVQHPHLPSVRGQVLWTEYDHAFVCWETGYEPYTEHRICDLTLVNALDLLVSGRELEYRHSWPMSKCSCGHILQRSRKRNKLICSRCRVHFDIYGTRSVQPDS